MIPAQILQRLDTLPKHPTYLYDLPALAKQARQVKQDLGNVRCLYAAKANPDPQILRVLAAILDGFEVASGGELQHVHHQHPQVPLAFGGPGKLASELQTALDLGIHRIHVESPRELLQLGKLARQNSTTAQVLLRVNLPLTLPSVPLAMGGKPSPFGMDVPLLLACLPLLKAWPEVQCLGVHLHLASGLKNAHDHLLVLQHALQWFESFVAQHRLNWTHVNLGGGMGVDYQRPEWHYPWSVLGAGLQPWQHLHLNVEPGRSLVAHCGYYCTPILDIKKSHGESFVIVQGGTHHFRTPAAQGHSHPCQVHPQGAAELTDALVNVVGQLCTPKDRLCTGLQVSGAAAGDWLVFEMAGAYAWNISHTRFLMHPEPHFVYLSEQQPAKKTPLEV